MTVVVVSTGGTIASKADEGGDAEPELTGEDLVAAVPALEDVADVRVTQFANIASQFFTLEQLVELRDLVREYDADPGVEGVVVTQGTNTMAESSYFLDLCYDGSTPVVFTGAMRNASLTSPDGPGNLLAAVMAAADDRAGEMGALVAFNDRLHTAREVRKTHTMNIDAFASTEFGPIGTIDEDRVTWRRRPEHPDPTMDPDPAALSGDVVTVTVTVDMASRLLAAATESDGLVLATMGAGHVPEHIVPAVRDVAEAGVPIFATSRVGDGRLLVDRYGYPGSEHLLRELGAYYSDVPPVKTRVRAIVALAADRLGDAFVRHPL